MKEEKPLVSVVCLCYNQERYVAEALESVAAQTYSEIELIVVDDGSSDGSKEAIAKVLASWASNHVEVTAFLDLQENLGNCKAFNQGLAACRGKYVIDLAADDVLDPSRIMQQVEKFEKLPDHFGVIYSDAEYIDETGRSMGVHRVEGPAEGDVYAEVVRRYFIPPPSMMMKRKVLQDLGGYDESLDYEDFDFWIRSTRKWHYGYLPQPLTRIRKVKGSLSSKFFQRGSKLAASTHKVCLNIVKLNANEAENTALVERVRYERNQCVLLGNRQIASDYEDLLRQLGAYSVRDAFVSFIARIPVNLTWLLRLRHWLRRD